jgi:HD-GYP domain-containing protein (c-di-GMP phosphodiesterase class II)
MNQTSLVSLRRAELLAALSLALDLGLGQPMENFLRTCLLAVRLGRLLGVSAEDLHDIYYLALIQHLGCTAYADETAAIFGDDLSANAWLLQIDQENPAEVLRALIQHVGADAPLLQRSRQLLHALMRLPAKRGEVASGHCEVGQRLAERIGLGEQLQVALGQIYERWDGQGFPSKLKGEALLLPLRVVRVAQDAEIIRRQEGVERARSMLRARAGKIYDPAIVDVFCGQADQLLEMPATSTWDAVLAAEPGQPARILDTEMDEVLRAIADFVDLKSPYTVGHSRGVATLAAAAAQRCGLPDADVIAVRRAGWLHDLGRIGVANTIWDKPGPLSDAEWERVRLHPYYTERVLARLSGLGQVRTIAAQHHERLDGSGYHRGLPASLLPTPARLLAAADVYHALTELRPHRTALPAARAADELRRQVRAGLLDQDAVHAVIDAAGHRQRATRRTWVAGLTDREIEVLRLLARGHSNRQMAAQLHVSERTIHHHIEHIYDKIDVSTRAGATLFAMHHNLLSDLDDAQK